MMDTEALRIALRTYFETCGNYDEQVIEDLLVIIEQNLKEEAIS